MSILLTGSSGFIGQALLKSEMIDASEFMRCSLMNRDVSSIDMSGIDAIFHFAGISLLKNGELRSRFFEVNTYLTYELAKKAKSSGVGYFLYLSSTKVYGDHLDRVEFGEEAHLEPTDDYGRSKLRAEEKIEALSDDSFKTCILRPSAVYGEGAKGNMNTIIGLIDKGVPLPLNGIENKRSMIYVGNLIALILKLYNERLTGFFIGTDNHPVSTTKLALAIKRHLKSKTILFKAPVSFTWLLRKTAKNIFLKLYASQYYKTNENYERINFVAPYSFDEGVRLMVQDYLRRKKND